MPGVPFWRLQIVPPDNFPLRSNMQVNSIVLLAGEWQGVHTYEEGQEFDEEEDMHTVPLPSWDFIHVGDLATVLARSSEPRPRGQYCDVTCGC